MNGYAGKILCVDLTSGTTSTLETARYAQWGGGHGMGSAIFWDRCQEKAISGFDPRNVVTIMTSPLSGTLAPGAGGRTEMQGVGVQSFPVEWFTRSNFGGRFGAMLKFAGWDGIVIEGRSERPVWLDIRDQQAHLRDASSLWGLDTWETQRRLWGSVLGRIPGGWSELGGKTSRARSTQRPAVLAIGPAGETLSRLGAVIHDAGNAAGQGGFGGVWGAKRLKAISVIGTGGVHIAHPDRLLEDRRWAREQYMFDPGDPDKVAKTGAVMPSSMFARSDPMLFWQRRKRSRPQACVGCHAACRARNDTGQGNESSCRETLFYTQFDARRHSNLLIRALWSLAEAVGQASLGMLLAALGKQQDAYTATDRLQQIGVNAYEMDLGLTYMRDLYKMGALGDGKAIDTDLPFDRLGDLDFLDRLLEQIVKREGIGADLAEGFTRAAARWGRLDEDWKTGLLDFPYWGLPNHGYDPRIEVEWGYGSILGDRDINEHCFNLLFWLPTLADWLGQEVPMSAEQMVALYAEKLRPGDPEPRMLDYSDANIYSDYIARLVAWHRHYTRFWKQSALFCDLLLPDFVNPFRDDHRGLTGEGEQRFFNSVTGQALSFDDGLEIGRRIWNLDNAIWTLQGRHRDMVHFADYIYERPFALGASVLMPGLENGRWAYTHLEGRKLDRASFEAWKTRYYELEGWDPESGWPTRSTLEPMELGHVADALEARGRLGGE